MTINKLFTVTFKIIVSVILFINLFFLFYRPVKLTGDSSWHLSTGEWIFQNGRVPREDVFAPSNQQKSPWVVIHWLGSTFYYAIFLLGGYAGLKLTKAALLIAPCLLCFFYARRKLPFPLLILLTYLISFGLLGYNHLRPLLFNFLFITLMLMILINVERTGRCKKLTILPFMAILWSNIHLGYFYYGNALLFIFSLSWTVQFIDKKYIKPDIPESQLMFKRLTAVGGAWLFFILAGLINPNGLAGAMYPYKAFLVPDHINLYKFGASIQEALPPVYLLSVSGWWFYVLCILTVGAVTISSRNRFSRFLLFCVTLFLFLYFRRMSGFFVITSFFIISNSVADAKSSEKWLSWKYAKLSGLIICIILTSVFILQIISRWNQYAFVDSKKIKTVTMDVDPHDPSQAIEFLHRNNITGPVYNSATLGGSIILNSYPRLRPLVDGRQVDQKLFAFYQMVNKKPELNWPQLHQMFRFQAVLLDASMPTSHKLLEYLNKSDQWEFSFLDGSFIVFLERGPNVSGIHQRSLEADIKAVDISNTDLDYLRSLDSQPRNNTIMNMFRPRYAYVDLFDEGIALFIMGYKGAALDRIAQVARKVDPRKIESIRRAAIQFVTEVKN